jgi:cobalt/nickel transport protein
VKRWLYVLLLLIVVGLAAAPFFLYPQGDFAGADGLAEEMILEIAPSYQRWMEPLWEPPSSEVESLLFALQAAVGGAIIGFYLGRATGKTAAKRIEER